MVVVLVPVWLLLAVGFAGCQTRTSGEMVIGLDVEPHHTMRIHRLLTRQGDRLNLPLEPEIGCDEGSDVFGLRVTELPITSLGEAPLEVACESAPDNAPVQTMWREEDEWFFMRPCGCTVSIRVASSLRDEATAAQSNVVVTHYSGVPTSSYDTALEFVFYMSLLWLLVVLLNMEWAGRWLARCRFHPGVVRVLGAVAMLFVLLLVMDEGKLVFDELGWVDPTGILDQARALMAMSTVAWIQGVFNMLLLILFVFELGDELEVERTPQELGNAACLIIGLNWAVECVQSGARGDIILQHDVIWMVALVVLGTIGVWERSLRGLSHGVNDPNASWADQVRTRTRWFVLMGLTLFLPLTETIVTRAVFLWVVVSWARGLWRQMQRPGTSTGVGHTESGLAKRLNMVPLDQLWMVKAQVYLAALSVLPLLFTWRLMLRPSPPTVSLYDYPIFVSLGHSLFIIVALFSLRGGWFSTRSLTLNGLAFLGSFVLFPLLFWDKFTLSGRPGLFTDANILFAAEPNVAPLVLILAALCLLVWAISTPYFHDTQGFLAGRFSEGRLHKSGLVFSVGSSGLLVCIVGATYYWIVSSLAARAASSDFKANCHHFATEMTPGMLVVALILIAVPWLLHRLGVGMTMRDQVKHLFIAAQHARESGSETTQTLIARYPWLADPTNLDSQVKAATTLPELAALKRTYLRCGWLILGWSLIVIVPVLIWYLQLVANLCP